MFLCGTNGLFELLLTLLSDYPMNFISDYLGRTANLSRLHVSEIRNKYRGKENTVYKRS